MPDLLVPLYSQKIRQPEELPGIRLKRGSIIDKQAILAFVGTNFSQSWVNECEQALGNQPSTVWLAVEGTDVVGFACYDATGKDYFGPLGVRADHRHRRIGTALLLACLNSLKEEGYAYAVIGWSDEATGFYQQAVGAIVIPGWTPQASIYADTLGVL